MNTNTLSFIISVVFLAIYGIVLYFSYKRQSKDLKQKEAILKDIALLSRDILVEIKLIKEKMR